MTEVINLTKGVVFPPKKGVASLHECISALFQSMFPHQKCQPSCRYFQDYFFTNKLAHRLLPLKSHVVTRLLPLGFPMFFCVSSDVLNFDIP